MLVQPGKRIRCGLLNEPGISCACCSLLHLEIPLLLLLCDIEIAHHPRLCPKTEQHRHMCVRGRSVPVVDPLGVVSACSDIDEWLRRDGRSIGGYWSW